MPKRRELTAHNGMRWPYERWRASRTARAIAYRRERWRHVREVAAGTIPLWFFPTVLVALLQLRHLLPGTPTTLSVSQQRMWFSYWLRIAGERVEALTGFWAMWLLPLAGLALSMVILILRLRILAAYRHDFEIRPGDEASRRLGMARFARSRAEWLKAWKTAEAGNVHLREVLAATPPSSVWSANPEAAATVSQAVPPSPFLLMPSDDGQGGLFTQEKTLPADAGLMHQTHDMIVASLVTAFAEASSDLTIVRTEVGFTDAIVACQMLDDRTQLWFVCSIYRNGNVIGVKASQHFYWWIARGYGSSGKFYVGDLESFAAPLSRRVRNVVRGIPALARRWWSGAFMLLALWGIPILGYVAALAIVLASFGKLRSVALYLWQELIAASRAAEQARTFLLTASPSFGDTADLRLLSDHRTRRLAECESPTGEMTEEAIRYQINHAHKTEGQPLPKSEFLYAENPTLVTPAPDAMSRGQVITARFKEAAKRSVQPVFAPEPRAAGPRIVR